MPKKQVNYRTIEIARLSRGIGQPVLAMEIGIAQGTLSKIESGILSASNDIIEKISKALDYPVDFFAEEITVPPSFAIHYRKKKVLQGIELQKMQYGLYIKKHFIKKLMKAVNITSKMVYLSPDEYGDPEAIAAIVRNKWGVPRGPINNLVNLVESVGVVILLVEFNDDNIDGEVIPDEDGLPVIYINKNMSADRIRFTLAHELGHLIMHSKDYIVPGEVAEKEANFFAAEFLMPSDDIRYQLDESLNLSRLADLKRHWKTSMVSIVMTASRIGAISDKKQKSLFAQLYGKGYKMKEPELGLQPENPTIVKQIFNIYFDQLNYSIEDLTELVPLDRKELRSIIDTYSNKTFRLSF